MFRDVISDPYFTFVTASKSFAAMVKHMVFLSPQLGRNLRIAFTIARGPVGGVSAARDNIDPYPYRHIDYHMAHILPYGTYTHI